MPQLELPRFGPCAGDEGRPRDITKAPSRLESITIRSGDVIDSIDFSYTDRDGQYHTMTRPWGGHGGADNYSVSVKRITLSFVFKYECIF